MLAACIVRCPYANDGRRGHDSQSCLGGALHLAPHLSNSRVGLCQCRVYNPYFLDDPEMRISKDRTVIKQEGYVVSCVPYVKPRTMKEELNGLFLAKHGDWLEDREVALVLI